jgi:hypothetical protein
MMEPIWGSFDANGSPLMVPFEREFRTTSINSQQQTQPDSETDFNPSSPYTPNELDFYLSSYDLFESVTNLNPDSIMDIHGERLANPTASDQAVYNSSSTVSLSDSEMNQAFGKNFFQPIGRELDDPEALNISWEAPAQDLTALSSFVGIDPSPPVIHEEQIGGLVQTPTMSLHESFDEPLNNQQAWAYRHEASNIYSPSIHYDYFLPHEAASATSSLSEYSDASSYCSGASSQSLSRPPVFLSDPRPPSNIKSGLFRNVPKTINEKAHKCNVCDKQFTRPSSLLVHLWAHTGEKRRISILCIGTQ